METLIEVKRVLGGQYVDGTVDIIIPENLIDLAKGFLEALKERNRIARNEYSLNKHKLANTPVKF